MQLPGTLVLRRKIGETVLIGEEPNRVAVTITNIATDEVSLLFKAPRSIPIDRLEIARQKERKARQNT